MSKVIWKYELETTSIQRIDMPANAEVLCVQLQNDIPCLWVLVDPKLAKSKRTFEIFGTGNPVPNANRTYIGTYQLMQGSLVFHCFELLGLWD